MAPPQAATTIRKTPNFDFIFGRYSLSRYQIPYFSVSMSFNDAAKYLKLVSEMPGAASMNWRIEELFQRDLDYARIEKKIVPYLKQENQPQFFNSLTIALLPIQSETVKTFQESAEWNAPSLDQEEGFASGTTKTFGPITCGYWGQWDDPDDDGARIGQLCWNMEEVCAIAIDGQHRLAAIKQLVGAGSTSYTRTTVPVILIVLHDDLANLPRMDRKELIEVLRRLFIDLNKHAQKVTRARQILLDDREPASVCVRALIGSQLHAGAAELDDSPPRVPLVLVDWHSERAKFDEGPYLVTVLGADWLVAKALGIKPLEDPMQFEKIDRLIQRLELNLSIDLDTAKQRLADCKRYDRPFGFLEEPVDELAKITSGFSETWAEPLVHLLSRFSPYRELVQLRSNRETLTPEFANWFALRQHAEEAPGSQAQLLLTQFERELLARTSEPVSLTDFKDALDAIDELKSSRKLAFTVVFQRAMMLAYLQLLKVSAEMLEALGGTEEIDLDEVLDEGDEVENGEDTDEEPLRLARARGLIDALNHVVRRESDFLKVDYEFCWDDAPERHDQFWKCSLQQPGGAIDFTQAASKRATDFLVLIGLFWMLREFGGLGADDFENLLGEVEVASRGIKLKVSQCLERMHVGDQMIAARILRSRDQELDEDALREEIRGRAAWLWSVVMASS